MVYIFQKTYYTAHYNVYNSLQTHTSICLVVWTRYDNNRCWRSDSHETESRKSPPLSFGKNVTHNQLSRSRLASVACGRTFHVLRFIFRILISSWFYSFVVFPHSWKLVTDKKSVRVAVLSTPTSSANTIGFGTAANARIYRQWRLLEVNIWWGRI